MSEEQMPQNFFNSRFFVVLCFVLGFLAGVVVGLTVQWTGGKHLGVAKIGEMLDTDFIYLKKGGLAQGQILAEEKGQILFSMENATLTFSPEEIRWVDRDHYTRYLKEVL
ncbi:MAG: hypothetical protein JW893_06970 [Candidatus Omnitrophica bacterium]|nr:hypothetical protein [Candidatus Omnitrophota bacterium]